MKVSLLSLVAFVLLLAGSCTTKKMWALRPSLFRILLVKVPLSGIKIRVLLSMAIRMLRRLWKRHFLKPLSRLSLVLLVMMEIAFGWRWSTQSVE